MKRSSLFVWWIACVAGIGSYGCGTNYVASEEGESGGEEEGEGGGDSKAERAGAKAEGKGGAGGGAGKSVGSGGKTPASGGSSGVGGNSDEAGGSQAGGSKTPDAGRLDAAFGTGGKQQVEASTGSGGSTETDGGSAKEGGGAGSTVVTGPTQCSFPSSWKPGSPTYTTYSFSQGTSQSDGKYQTACGYQGTNSGGDTVANIANSKNFAAIPGKSSQDFDTKDRCGACVQIGNAIITIIDECPYDTGNQPCKNNPSGHLDLSSAGAGAAGVQGDPNRQGQAAWKFVPCPVNGNVVVRLKKGNNNEIYIENTIMPLASVTCDSQQGSRQNYGAWHFEKNLNGCTMTLTDVAGRSIEVKAGTTQDQNVDTGVQFPKCL